MKSHSFVDTDKAAFDHIATKFFSLPNYYMIPPVQHAGSVKDCVLFAFYLLQNMLASLGASGTIEALAYLRNVTRASSGRCVHIQLMTPPASLAKIIEDPGFGIDSHTVREFIFALAAALSFDIPLLPGLLLDEIEDCHAIS